MTTRYRRRATAFALTILVSAPTAQLEAAALSGAPSAACHTDRIPALSPELAEAVHAMFPVTARRGSLSCAFPLRLLSFETADVLLTLEQPPGQTCQACAATVWGTALTKANPGRRLSRTFQIGKLGEAGDPGTAKGVRIGSRDGVLFETKYQAQGYTSTVLTLFAFQGGKAIELAGATPIILSADDTDALIDRGTKVTGTWRIQDGPPPVLRIDYAIGGKSATIRAAWRVDPTRLVGISGGVPPEAIAASGH